MEPILGIDLGTTNSEVAVIRNGKAEVLREDGEAMLPSVVGLDTDGRLLVGAPRLAAVFNPRLARLGVASVLAAICGVSTTRASSCPAISSNSGANCE